MADSFSVTLYQTQLRAATRELHRCNEVSQRYGLALTDTQILSLVQARFEALQTAGRMELGESLLPRLVYAFCDSPYINQSDYLATLMALQELFYTFKNECDDTLTDDELIEALKNAYNKKAHGSLEYLENMTVSDLYHALTGVEDEEEEAGYFDDGEL